jgi:hypothetical protein
MYNQPEKKKEIRQKKEEKSLNKIITSSPTFALILAFIFFLAGPPQLGGC